MINMTNVYITGLGAIGSMIASRLQKNCRLKVIVDAGRKKKYSEEGIYVNEEKYDFDYITPYDTEPPADLLIIAVKNRHLEQVIETIRLFVGKNTSILSLLNGIDSEQIIGNRFGMEHMLYSFIVATDSVRVKNRTHYTNVGKIVFGEKNSEITPRVTAVKSLLESSGIGAETPGDIIKELWWKFMLNVGINQTSAILRAPYGLYRKSEAARALMRDACMDVLAIAQKKNINLTTEDIEKCFRIINGLAADGKTSMLQDVEACRETELETFAGTVIRMGKELGIPTPVNETLYMMIKVIEESYESNISRHDRDS